MLPRGLVAPVRVVGVLAFVVVVWAISRRRGIPDSGPEPSPHAGRTYAIAVIAMIIAFPLGGVPLRALGESQLMLPWVVLVVGAHFFPFARAFRVPLFIRLSMALMALAVLGGVAVLLDLPAAAGWTGVAAGVVLLGFGAIGARR